MLSVKKKKKDGVVKTKVEMLLSNRFCTSVLEAKCVVRLTNIEYHAVFK